MQTGLWPNTPTCLLMPHLSLSLWQTDLDTSFFFTLWLECVYHAGLAEAGLLSSCTSSSVQEYCTWHSAWGCFSQKATHVHYYLWLWYICQLQMKDETMNIRHIHCRTQTKTSKCPFTSCSIHWYHIGYTRCEQLSNDLKSNAESVIVPKGCWYFSSNWQMWQKKCIGLELLTPPLTKRPSWYKQNGYCHTLATTDCK